MADSNTVSLSKRTYGEKLVASLVSKLPKDLYFAVAQPTLIDREGRGWKPDFVIVSARLGVVILEIKDWISIKDIDRENVTIEKRDGTSLTLPNPVETAQNYAYVLSDMFKEREELLVQHRNVRRLVFPWQYAVALPNISRKTIERITDAGIWEEGVAFGREDLQSPETFTQAITNLPWRFQLRQPINRDTLDIIRGVLQPSLKIVSSEGEDIGTETVLQTQLIQETLPQPQLMGLETDTFTVRLIRGVAGSGKTLVLMRRVLHLIEHYQDMKIAVLSFNRDLADNLRRQIPYESVDVMDFHQLCFKITGWMKIQKPIQWLEKHAATQLETLNLSAQFVADEIAWRKEVELEDNQEYLQTVRIGRGTKLTHEKRLVINQIFQSYTVHQAAQRSHERPWATWEDMPQFALEILQTQTHEFAKHYDVILIDEAQDFAPLWFKVIKAVLKPNGALLICDDPTQSIFRSYSWRQKGIDVVGHTRILRVPFRNTHEISLAAHSLIESDRNLKQNDDLPVPNFNSHTLTHGSLPQLIEFADEAQEITFIRERVAYLLGSGVAGNQIAVLCP